MASTKVFRFLLDSENESSAQYRDPFDLHRRWYEATSGDPATLLRAVQPPEPRHELLPDGREIEQPAEESKEDYLNRLRAYDQLVKVVREIFELPSFDKSTGQGILDNDALRILNEWDEWEGDVKKNTAPVPTSSPPSASTPKAQTTSAIPKKNSPSGS